MAGHITDQASALIQMNQAMQKVVLEMERVAVSATGAASAMDKIAQFGQSVVHIHFLIESIFGHGPSRAAGGLNYPGGGAAGGLGGAAGGLGGLRGSPALPHGYHAPDYNRDALHGVLTGGGYSADMASEVIRHIDRPDAHSAAHLGATLSSMRAATTPGGTPKYTPAEIKRFEQIVHQAGHSQANAAKRKAEYLGDKGLEKEKQRLADLDLTTRKLNAAFLKTTDVFAEFGKKGLAMGAVSVGAASPDIMGTLAGSWKLLSAQIGTTLTPFAIKAAHALQQAAHGFERLSDSSKASIGRLLALSIAIGGLAAGARATGLTTALSYGGSTIANSFQGIGAAGTRPGRMALGGLGIVAAAGVTAGFLGYRSQSNAAEAEAAQSHGALFGSEMSRNQLLMHGEFKEMRATPKEERAAYLTELTNRHSALVRRQEANNTGLFHYKDEKLNEQVRQSGERLHVAQAAYRELKNPGSFKGGAGYAARSDNATMQAHGLLTDIQSQNQPAYFSVEDIYKHIQLKALQESPLQEEIKRIQQKQLDELMKMSEWFKNHPDYKSSIL